MPREIKGKQRANKEVYNFGQGVKQALLKMLPFLFIL